MRVVVKIADDYAMPDIRRGTAFAPPALLALAVSLALALLARPSLAQPGDSVDASQPSVVARQSHARGSRLPGDCLAYAAGIHAQQSPPHLLLVENSTAEFDFNFSEQEFAAMFANGRAPFLRIIIDVQ